MKLGLLFIYLIIALSIGVAGGSIYQRESCRHKILEFGSTGWYDLDLISDIQLYGVFEICR